MTQRTVLISGAGIAGPALAYWLARKGFRPTVVERAERIRSSGSPVDVRGRAVGIAERMGIVPALREAATEVSEMVFVNTAGRRTGRINIGAIQRAGRSRDIELPRGDLAGILYEASRDDAEFLFHDSVSAIHQDDGGVDVDFEHASPRRFDLVVGADGLHSTVRRLVFGPERRFVEHLGIYVATVALPTNESPRSMVMHNMPGRAVAVHPSRGGPIAFFAFRSPVRADFDPRDSVQHKRMLAEAFAGDGWRVPELLDAVRGSDDLYFDSVSRVALRPWSSGRVGLLGDAASCVSLFGGGSTLAMTGAHTLAEALAAAPDHRAAFQRYESTHRELVDPKLRGLEQGAALLIPTTTAGIATRNLLSRLWPLASAASWLTRSHRAA
jgi:2-polyprenyl-6-methoxyphenol hydroxylase-like FAD-dependent oxidoreductase